jgi:hypothetical protein
VLWVKARMDWPVEYVLDSLFDAVSPLVPVEKSPVTVASNENLERAFRLYPRARLIHLVRHPVPTIESMVRHWGPWGDAARLGDRFVSAVAEGWLDTQRRVSSALGVLDEKRWCRLRAEDVLARPQQVLERLALRFGLVADEGAIGEMLHPERSPYALAGGGNDPQFLRDPRPRPLECPSQVAFPSAWRLDERVEDSIRGIAASFGYRV